MGLGFGSGLGSGLGLGLECGSQVAPDAGPLGHLGAEHGLLVGVGLGLGGAAYHELARRVDLVRGRGIRGRVRVRVRVMGRVRVCESSPRCSTWAATYGVHRLQPYVHTPCTPCAQVATALRGDRRRLPSYHPLPRWPPRCKARLTSTSIVAWSSTSYRYAWPSPHPYPYP